jgi:hypothetical protein
MWWQCERCNAPVDEFEKQFDQAEEDGQRLCRSCRFQDDLQWAADVLDGLIEVEFEEEMV